MIHHGADAVLLPSPGVWSSHRSGPHGLHATTCSIDPFLERADFISNLADLSAPDVKMVELGT